MSWELQDILLESRAEISKLKAFAHDWCNRCLPGRDEELRQLHHMMISSSKLTVWGPPDVGKNTLVNLVKKVYSCCVLTDPPPFQLYGWVDVSSNPDPEQIQDFFFQRLLEYMQPQLTVPIPDFVTNDTGTIKHYLADLLTTSRCLVVIDGLNSVYDCDKLIYPTTLGMGFRCHNSCIIVITEEESVATLCKQALFQVLNVKPLKQVCIPLL
jgi:hypothetical protein